MNNNKYIKILNADIKFLPEPHKNPYLLKCAVLNKYRTHVKFISSEKVYQITEFSTRDFKLSDRRLNILEAANIIYDIEVWPNRYTSLEKLLDMEDELIKFQRKFYPDCRTALTYQEEQYYNF